MNLKNEVPAVENAVLETASSGLTNGQKVGVIVVSAVLGIPAIVWATIKLCNHVKSKRAAKKSKVAVPETADANSDSAN